jgi:ADP-heptose:LPS heptosyltransferase
VITTDTSVAHLAGSIGVPTWVFLNHSPDWRWLIGREDCPWYPSMRLFRQKRDCCWEEPLEEVYNTLLKGNHAS